jgi:uncharacterized protein involved in outer membrane biogenesis
LSTLIKLKKRARWSLFACGITILILLFVVPLLVKHQAIKWVATHTSRTLVIDSLRINPLTLGVTLRGVNLSEADEPATAFVAFDRLDLSLSLRSVWDRAIILKRLRLEGPKVRLVRIAANTYNFADLQALGDQPKDEASPPPEKEKPLLFSVNNIAFVDGCIDFIDRALSGEKHHTVRELNIGIPFIGNIPYLADLYVTPSLRAKINDAPFVFDGKLKPFKDGSETILDLTFDNFDLAHYTPYLPAALPLRIKSGLFDSKVTVAYRVAKDLKPEVELVGSMHLADFAADGVDGTPLAAVRNLGVEFFPSRPLDGDIFFKTVDIGGVQLFVHRNKLGAWNLPGLQGPEQLSPPPQVVEKSAEEETASPLRLRIQNLRLAESSIAFHDEIPVRGFRTHLQQISGEVKDFDNGAPTAAVLSFNFTSAHHEDFALNGGFSVKPLSADLDFKLERLSLATYYPYLQTQLTAPISGLLSLQGKVRFDEEAGVRLSDGSLLLEALQIPFRSGEGLSLPRLAANGMQADLNRQTYHLEELFLEQGRVNLTRYRNGRWSPLDLLRQTQKLASAPVASAPPKSPPQFTLGRLRLNNWRAEFHDETVDNTLTLSKLNIAVDKLDYPQLTVDRAALTASCDGGRLNLEAGGRLEPLALNGRLQLKHLPLPRFWAYVPPEVKVLLVTGDLNSDLRFRIVRKEQELSGDCRGSLGVGNLYLVNSDDADDLLRWENFNLDNIALDLGQSRLTIAEVALSGLVTQLTIAPDGTLNFSKVVEKEEAAIAPSPAAPLAPEPQPRDWFVSIDKVTIQNGRIDFTDRHMVPPFHAEMINLGGRISGLSSSPEMQADVDIRGNLESRSPLQIVGTMNPLSKTPQVDLKVLFSDIELSPATPYTGRYLGYTVDKGKLFLELNYQVENKELNASNKIFLDQFAFGSSVKSADAVNLPVKLAVALLKDRNGEIHLDVPVSGKTDDPEFSLLRIVWQVLKNLLIKAATSPLALLTSFAGGGDFSAVQFAPGSAELSATDRENLAKLANALVDRPTLKLEISGHAEATIDEEAYRRQLLENRIKRVKFLELVRNKEITAGQTAETIEVTVAERGRYLKEVYRKGDFPKPRNAIGLLKDLSDAEMEKLILSHTLIGPAQLSELAWARSAAVKNELVERNGFPAERIFQNNVAIVRPPGKPDDWSGNRVEFGVATD